MMIAIFFILNFNFNFISNALALTEGKIPRFFAWIGMMAGNSS
jgi:hypothetical protein